MRLPHSYLRTILNIFIVIKLIGIACAFIFSFIYLIYCAANGVSAVYYLWYLFWAMLFCSLSILEYFIYKWMRDFIEISEKDHEKVIKLEKQSKIYKSNINEIVNVIKENVLDK